MAASLGGGNSTRILVGDIRDRIADIPDNSVQAVVTSPPYWGLRNYGDYENQVGREDTFDQHLEVLIDIFGKIKRVMKKNSTLWLNYGDSYYNTKMKGKFPGKLRPKDLLMMPSRVAMALQSDGWYLRSEIVYAKTNPIPEPSNDRPTTSHEKIFLMTTSPKYFYDSDAVRTPLMESSIERYGDDPHAIWKVPSYVNQEDGIDVRSHSDNPEKTKARCLSEQCSLCKSRNVQLKRGPYRRTGG